MGLGQVPVVEAAEGTELVGEVVDELGLYRDFDAFDGVECQHPQSPVEAVAFPHFGKGGPRLEVVPTGDAEGVNVSAEPEVVHGGEAADQLVAIRDQPPLEDLVDLLLQGQRWLLVFHSTSVEASEVPQAGHKKCPPE